LAILDDRVVNLKLARWRDHVIGAVTFEKEIAGETKFPVVIRIVDKRGFGEDSFESEMIGEKPDQAAARRHDRIRINCAAGANHGKDLVFFKWERDPNLPRDIERVAIGVILKIDARIEFNSSAGMIMDDVFVGEERMNRLQMVGQSIVG